MGFQKKFRDITRGKNKNIERYSVLSVSILVVTVLTITCVRPFTQGIEEILFAIISFVFVRPARNEICIRISVNNVHKFTSWE